MRTCFLMGQHDASDAIQQWVCEELDKLVRYEGVTQMIVGHRGSFDRMGIAAIQGFCGKSRNCTAICWSHITILPTRLRSRNSLRVTIIRSRCTKCHSAMPS